MSRHHRRGVATGAVQRILNRSSETGTRSWFQISNKRLVDKDSGKTDTEVWIYDEIGGWGVTSQDFARELREIDSDTITLRLNSPGGEVYAGIAIMNSLIDHPARVVVKIDALAASIASVIAMAGDEVIMGSHSEFMIHDASTIAMGNAAEIQEVVDTLKRVSENIAEVYAERAGGKAEDWRALMLAETWFSAEEAVEIGLADKLAPKPTKREESDVEDVLTARPWDLSGFKHSSRRTAGAPALARLRAGGASKKETPDAAEDPKAEAEDETEASAAAETCEHDVAMSEACTECEREATPDPDEQEEVEELEDVLASTDFRSLFAWAVGDADNEVSAPTDGIDAEIFHHAVKGVTDAAVPLPSKVEPTPTAPPAAPVFPVDKTPDEGEELRQIFRAAVELAANDAPAVPLKPKPTPTNTDSDDSFVIDPVEFYNSLKEAIHQ